MDILLSVLFVIVCVLLILVVLLQKGRGGGLGAAFGGAASSAFGTRVGDVFTWVTVGLVATFLLLAIGTTLAHRPEKQTLAAPILRPGSSVDNEPVMVTIDIDAQEKATIYYTADGTEPDRESTEYDGAIRVKPGTQIKARAYRTSWHTSPVSQGLYGPAELFSDLLTDVPALPTDVPALPTDAPALPTDAPALPADADQPETPAEVPTTAPAL